MEDSKLMFNTLKEWADALAKAPREGAMVGSRISMTEDVAKMLEHDLREAARALQRRVRERMTTN